MTHHILKIEEVFWHALVEGDKPFEIRNNRDRGFQKGDTLTFNVIDPDTGGIYPEQEDAEFEITYVTNFEQKPDYVVFGLKAK